MHVPDAELVSRSLMGDRESFVLLARRYLPVIYDFVGRLVLEAHDADQATRDTFVQAQRQLPSLRDPETFREWLFGVAYVRAAQVMRGGTRSETIAEGAAAIPDELDRAVWTAVARLEPSTRAALDLHVRHDFEPAAVARVLGVDAAHADAFVANVREEVRARLPQVDDPFGAYAELGEVDPPDQLEELIVAELAGLLTDTGRPGILRRAAVAVAILSITGLVAAYAAPRLAPEPASLDAAGAERLPAAGATPETSVPRDVGRDPDAAVADDRAADDQEETAGADEPADADPADGSVDGADAGGGADAFSGGDVYPEDDHDDPGSPPRAVEPDASDAPTVQIISPENGHVATAQDLGGGRWAAQVSAVAEASDPDGQQIEGRWYSDRQPEDLSRSARATFWLVLPDGCPGDPLVHTVGVEVTDPDGNVARDSIDIEVRCP